jgi:hypothetical protein
METYNVIWFDDEFQSLEYIIEKALANNIHLVGFTNSEDGINELEMNIAKYDAAIVDGLFFRSKDQSGVANSDKALKDVALTFEKLSFKKRLPWFILSGQTSFTKEQNTTAHVFKENEVFDKLAEDDLNSLWLRIKVEADKHPETQLRHKYANVFSVCDEKYLGSDLFHVLIDLLKEHEFNIGGSVSENKLNAIRKVVERIFRVLSRIGVIPKEVILSNGSINNASKFLAGLNESYVYTSEIAPPSITFLLRNILNVTQDGSHSGDELKLRIDQFVKSQPTGFLFSSVLFQLLEVMIWTKSFVDTHQNLEKNMLLTSLKVNAIAPKYTGKIEQDSKGNYYCGEYLLSYKLVKGKFRVGDIIKIFESSKNNDPRTDKFYPEFAINVNVCD